MPTVGKKHFSYSPEGYTEAKDYAKKSGKKLKVKHPGSNQLPSKVKNSK